MTHEVQFTIPYFNALPRDCATNVWHFNRIGAAPVGADFLALCATIEGFYQEVYQDIDSFAAYGNFGAVHSKVYDLTDPTPRSPVYERTGVLSVSVDEAPVLPPESAVVLSIHGAGVSGTPAASQRGRVYIGCLGNGIVSAGGGAAFPTVGEGFRTQLAGAANAFSAAAIVAGWNWVILSRKLATTYQVVGGWVDDAFDIQRRRGQDPTIRNTWP